MHFGYAVIVVTTLALGFAGAAHAADADKGAKVFKKCRACHKVGDGAKNGIGPYLTDVIGRQAGTADGYHYGKSMIAAGESGLVWSEALVAQYIENPTEFLRTYLNDPKARAKMPLKVKKTSDRENVAAYLATFAPAPTE